MRVLVCGGRDYDDVDRVYQTLDALVPGPTLIIHGKATGADSIGEMWADERGVAVVGYEAHWDDLETPPVVVRRRRDGRDYNAAAGGIRNQRMLDEGKPELVVAFPTPGKPNKGTSDMMRRARAAGVKVVEII